MRYEKKGEGRIVFVLLLLQACVGCYRFPDGCCSLLNGWYEFEEVLRKT